MQIKGHLYYEFQSTLPQGERLLAKDNVNVADIISIHAPARGATTENGCRIYLLCISIHAPARGATITTDTMTTDP